MANLPYDPRGFPDSEEELLLVKIACLDTFGACGDEVPALLLRSLHQHQASVVGTTRLSRMSAAAARADEKDHRFISLANRIAELERKRMASGKHITDLHRKLAKLRTAKLHHKPND